MRVVIATVCLLGCTALAGAAPPMVPITACGDVVPRHAIGYLTGDLDCTGFTAMPGAVMLSKSATLELRGFTITGGLFGIVCGEMRPRQDLPPALYSSGKCTVVGGGGRVTGAGAHGILGDKPTVSDVTIDGCDEEGIFASLGSRVSNATVTGNGGAGMRIDGQAYVLGSTITGNGEDGIRTKRLRMKLSSAIGNVVGAVCGPYPKQACADLVVGTFPRLDGSACGTSLIAGPGVQSSWHVCTDD